MAALWIKTREEGHRRPVAFDHLARIDSNGVWEEEHVFRLQAVGAFETRREVKCRRCEQKRTPEPVRLVVDARHRSAIEREQTLRDLAALFRYSDGFYPARVLGRARIANPDDGRRAWQRAKVHAIAQVVINRQQQIEPLAPRSEPVCEAAGPPRITLVP